MGWSAARARKALKVEETDSGKAIYTDIRVKVYDNGIVHVNGEIIGDRRGGTDRHAECEACVVLSTLATELFYQADKHRQAQNRA